MCQFRSPRSRHQDRISHDLLGKTGWNQRRLGEGSDLDAGLIYVREEGKEERLSRKCFDYSAVLKIFWKAESPQHIRTVQRSPTSPRNGPALASPPCSVSSQQQTREMWPWWKHSDKISEHSSRCHYCPYSGRSERLVFLSALDNVWVICHNFTEEKQTKKRNPLFKPLQVMSQLTHLITIQCFLPLAPLLRRVSRTYIYLMSLLLTSFIYPSTRSQMPFLSRNYECYPPSQNYSMPFTLFQNKV